MSIFEKKTLKIQMNFGFTHQIEIRFHQLRFTLFSEHREFQSLCVIILKYREEFSILRVEFKYALFFYLLCKIKFKTLFKYKNFFYKIVLNFNSKKFN